MGSQVLPQALHMIPRNPTHCPSPKKLGFATFISRAPLLTTRVSVSRTSQNLCGSNFSFFVSAPTKRGFVVRADANSEAEVSENGGEEEEVSGAEAEAIAEGEIKAEEAEGITEGELKAEDAEVKEPRKPRIKLGDIMGILNKRAVEASEKERPIPDIRTGDIVEIKLEVPQNKRRLSIYKGIVMSRQNAGIHTTIRIRRIIAGVGIEIVFPLYSPNIKEIKVMKHRKVRRARLYYLRDKLPRFSTFK